MPGPDTPFGAPTGAPLPPREIPNTPEEIAAKEVRERLQTQLRGLQGEMLAKTFRLNSPQWTAFQNDLRNMQSLHGRTETWRQFQVSLSQIFQAVNQQLNLAERSGPMFGVERIEDLRKNLNALAAEVTPGRTAETLTPEQRLNMQMNQIDGRITDMVGRLPPNVQAFLGGPEGAARTVRNLFSTLALNFSGNALTRAFAPQINKLGAEMALKNQIEAINPPPTPAQIGIWRGLLEAATKAKRANPARITELPMPNMQEIIANPNYPKIFQEELNKMLATPPAAPTVAPNAAVNIGGINFVNTTTEVTPDATNGQRIEIAGNALSPVTIKRNGEIIFNGGTMTLKLPGTTNLRTASDGAIRLLAPATGNAVTDMRIQVNGDSGSPVVLTLQTVLGAIGSRTAGHNHLQINAVTPPTITSVA